MKRKGETHKMYNAEREKRFTLIIPDDAMRVEYNVQVIERRRKRLDIYR